MFEEYPQEFFVKLDHDFLEARITLNLLDGCFSSELDLVQRESRKIWKHLAVLGPFSSKVTKDEALDLSVQGLSNLLRQNSP